MNKNDLYLADPTAETPTYIQFMFLVFKSFDVSVLLKTEDEEIINTNISLSIWKWNNKLETISLSVPPLLDITSHNRQLFEENGEEIYNLYQEAMMQGAYEQLEKKVMRIKIYDFRRAYNISNSELTPKNRWVVYTGSNLPDYKEIIVNKYFSNVK